MGKTRSS